MKVLLADDEIFTIRMLQSVIHWSEMGLELVGYAQNGEEAYEKVVNCNPEIIISDIRMPGMDGLTFLEKVHNFNSGIRVILMSAYADFSYVKEGMRLGCSDYILKPVDESELEQALGKVIYEIQGEKVQEKIVQKSKKQMDYFNIYHYMRTEQGRNKALKSWQGYKIDSYYVLLVQLNSTTIEEYNNSVNMEIGNEEYIAGVLERAVLGSAPGCMIFDYDENCWTIILQNDQSVKCESVAKRIIADMQAEIGMQLKVCFSTCGETMDQLPELYEEVCSLNKYGFYIGEEDIFGYGYNCDRDELTKIRDIGNLKDKQSIELAENLETISDLTKRWAEQGYSRPVQESIKLILDNYNLNLSLEDICSKISVSKNYFCYLFKRETGMSLWNYLTVVRLQHAKELLDETTLRSYEIAFQVGYDNPSYFSKIFKKYENMTPSEYRDREK